MTVKSIFTTVKNFFKVVKIFFTVVKSIFTVVKSIFTVVKSIFTVVKSFVRLTWVRQPLITLFFNITLPSNESEVEQTIKKMILEFFIGCD
jgi:hypothetical protein